MRASFVVVKVGLLGARGLKSINFVTRLFMDCAKLRQNQGNPSGVYSTGFTF